MTGYKSIKIPKELYNCLIDCVSNSEYNNVNDLILSTLRERIAIFNAEQDAVSLSKNDEERVKERLRELGYLG